mmetsp:Transcript_42295/g.30499  ORF Transcript_42295/g.30499 Transcript_42295/m.30499 type:complete len:97 (+) Transcript_42295:990-1280(+)
MDNSFGSAGRHGHSVAAIGGARHAEALNDFMVEVNNMKGSLSKLELELTNNLRPLLDVHGDQSLYDKVLDQIVRGNGENKISDVENMRMIIDEVQV